MRPLQNEPFYGALSKPGPAPAGVALRGFAPSLVTAAAAGDFTNSTLFGFEAYARWRVLQGSSIRWATFLQKGYSRGALRA